MVSGLPSHRGLSEDAGVSSLPPGPAMPPALQTLGFVARPLPFLERARARHGRRFTIRLVGAPPFVLLSDPEQVREVFTTPPDVLHPGEGTRVLEPVVGPNSVLLLDGDRHLAQRRLMLPAFHGEKMAALSALVGDVAEREVAAWPVHEKLALHPRLQALTLEVILRAVFGLKPGERLEALRRSLTALLDLAGRPMSIVTPLQRSIAGRGPWARLLAVRATVDEQLFALVDERRAGGDEGDDVLTMLLAARHEDGSPMSRQELRDELVTLLVAGHETTASQLSWAFERLPRERRVLRRLVAAVDAGDETYLTATVQETLRRRPVLPNVAPRLIRKPVTVGGWDYEPGACLVPNAYLLHHDAAVYDDPYAFRPERFLDEPPGTYTWIPFGGGRRRCLGASFAMLEMHVVLRAVLHRHDLVAGSDGPELARRRAITISPRGAATTVLRPRVRQGDPAAA
jgi:cytochrome P450